MMRIAQISTLNTPVCQENSDSVESLVWLLARELTCLGHEVTVFAAAGSDTFGELVDTLPGPYASAGSPGDWKLCEWINLCRAIEQSSRFDVLHSHANLWGLPLQALSQAPIVHTMHVCPYQDDACLWSMMPESFVTAISRYQWSDYPHLRPSAVIYHAVDPSQFTLQLQAEDYVCYLGRFTSGKGPLLAIATARTLGLKLLVAGPPDAYYERYVKPLVDGRSAEYVGYVSGPERDRLLGGARALLYPIQSPEPFGLVLVEAMMCGTPVVGMRLGAVPEIVDEGITGYCAETKTDFARQVLHSFTLDRLRVRQRAEERFSVDRMTREYLKVYEELAHNHQQRPTSSEMSLQISEF